jgi:hypothetical protein
VYSSVFPYRNQLVAQTVGQHPLEDCHRRQLIVRLQHLPNDRVPLRLGLRRRQLALDGVRGGEHVAQAEAGQPTPRRNGQRLQQPEQLQHAVVRVCSLLQRLGDGPVRGANVLLVGHQRQVVEVVPAGPGERQVDDALEVEHFMGEKMGIKRKSLTVSIPNWLK